MYSYPELKLSNKVYRALWSAVELVVFSLTPRPMHWPRVTALKLFGASIGKRVKVYNNVSVWCPSNLSIGDDSTIGPGCEIYSVDKVSIGCRTVVSQRSYLCTASHDYNTRGSSKSWNGPLVCAPISIGDDCWVAARCFVVPGISMSNGSVLLGGSVLKVSTNTWSVYGGNPASFCRVRRDI